MDISIFLWNVKWVYIEFPPSGRTENCQYYQCCQVTMEGITEMKVMEGSTVIIWWEALLLSRKRNDLPITGTGGPTVSTCIQQEKWVRSNKAGKNMNAKSPVCQELHDNSSSLKTEEWKLIVLLRHLLLLLLDTEDNITRTCKGIQNRKKTLWPFISYIIQDQGTV